MKAAKKLGDLCRLPVDQRCEDLAMAGFEKIPEPRDPNLEVVP
jgi:hypothetical protein